MPPATLPAGDPRRPAEARPHPPLRPKGPTNAEMPDLRSMLATLLAVLAIMAKVKAAAWASAILLLSATVNLQGKEMGPLISALPAVVFGFVAIYRTPSGVDGAGPTSPREAFSALVARFTGR